MKRRNVWVAEERKKRDEEEAKAELKRKVARKGKVLGWGGRVSEGGRKKRRLVGLSDELHI